MTAPPPQEKELLEGLAQNRTAAVEALYRGHYDVIQAMVVNSSGTADDARDLFQEALVVLYEKAKTPQFSLDCSIRTYLYAVSRRLWLKKLTAAEKWGKVRDIDESPDIEDDLEEHRHRDAAFEAMEKAMGGMGEPCRSLLEAFYMQKRSMQEIADSFGYTNADNAKTQKYKCLVRLKKLFHAQHKTEQ